MRPIGIEETDDGDLLVRFDQHRLEQAQAIAMLLGEDVVVLKAAPSVASASPEPQQVFAGMGMPLHQSKYQAKGACFDEPMTATEKENDR